MDVNKRGVFPLPPACVPWTQVSHNLSYRFFCNLYFPTSPRLFYGNENVSRQPVHQYVFHEPAQSRIERTSKSLPGNFCISDWDIANYTHLGVHRLCSIPPVSIDIVDTWGRITPNKFRLRTFLLFDIAWRQSSVSDDRGAVRQMTSTLLSCRGFLQMSRLKVEIVINNLENTEKILVWQ